MDPALASTIHNALERIGFFDLSEEEQINYSMVLLEYTFSNACALARLDPEEAASRIAVMTKTLQTNTYASFTRKTAN